MKVKNIEWDKIPKKLVYIQDCTKEITDDNYFEIGRSKVVETELAEIAPESKYHLMRQGEVMILR